MHDVVQAQPNPRLLAALNAASMVLQSRVSSEEEIFRVFEEQLALQGLYGSLAFLFDEGWVVVRAFSAAPLVPGEVKHLTGRLSQEIVFPVHLLPFTQQVIQEKRCLFFEDGASVVEPLLSARYPSFREKILSAFRGQHCIIAPLIQDGRVEAALNVVGTELSRADIPCMQALANQVALARQNTRLLAELECSQARLEMLSAGAVPAPSMDRIESQVASQPTSRIHSAAKRTSWQGEPVLRPYAATQNQIDLMLSICQDVSLALSSTTRYQEGEARLKETAQTYAAGLSWIQPSEPENLLDQIVKQLASRLGYPQVQILLLEGQYLVLKAYSGPQPRYAEFPIDKGVMGRVVRTQQAAFIPDVSQDTDYFTCVPDNKSEIAVPIFRSGQVVGIINVESDLADHLGAFDRDLLQVLAGQLSIALENAVLYERVRRHAEDLEATVAQRTAELTELYQLGQEISYQLSYEELLRLLLYHLRKALSCDLAIGCLFTTDSRTLFVDTERPLSPGLFESLQNLGAEKLRKASQVHIDPHEVQIVLTQPENGPPIFVPLERAGAAMQAPVIADGVQSGLLIAMAEGAAAFGPEQERLLKTFANQASSAFQRLRAILSAQQKHLESLVENMPIGILLFDSEYNLLVANSLGREILSALNEAQPPNAPLQFGDFTLPDLIARYLDPLPIEITLESSPGRVFAVQTRQIQDVQHQWLLAVREITQERENQMRIQGQERLATVGQLAAGIAHDFNNILAAILVYADLLSRDSQLAAPSREKLKIIQQQVQRASSLIRQVLDFSRRGVLEQSALDLLPFIKEMDKMLGRVLPETIQLGLIYQPGYYWVNADPTRLQQVFMNLALNSRDAMPDGGRLNFELSRFRLSPHSTPPIAELPPGEWIRIAVQDTGIGIPPEALPYIFDPFFTTKPVGQGTGLGLAQVYGIIKQHDGYIDVRSRPGQGTTFVIYLPALTSLEEESDRFELPGSRQGNGELILLVEDNESTRLALQAMLEAHNYRVITANNGVEALQRYQAAQAQIALVVSDVVMPGLGGLALHRALKEKGPAVKMIFITGHPMEAENQALLQLSSVRWLQKPFSVVEFTQAVYALLHPV